VCDPDRNAVGLDFPYEVEVLCFGDSAFDKTTTPASYMKVFMLMVAILSHVRGWTRAGEAEPDPSNEPDRPYGTTAACRTAETRARDLSFRRQISHIIDLIQDMIFILKAIIAKQAQRDCSGDKFVIPGLAPDDAIIERCYRHMFDCFDEILIRLRGSSLAEDFDGVKKVISDKMNRTASLLSVDLKSR
jgi:hypothetical protein